MLSEEDTLVYYGPLNVNLYQVTGVFRAFAPERVKQDSVTSESTKKVLKNLEDLSYLDKAYTQHYIPCVPATLITLESPTPDSETEKGPECVMIPLLKLPEGPEDEKSCVYKGITSGHRSAILRGEGKTFYRLKGCGNDLKGFIVEKSEGYPFNFGLRGSQFEDTAVRELYYAHHIHNILRPYNIPSANYPVGFWKYSRDLKVLSPAEKKDQPENHMPKLDKYCSVFATLGERRLGSHLLGGFELILRAIVRVAIEKFGANEGYLKEVLGLYPPGREDKYQPTFMVLRNFDSPFVNGKQMSLKEWCKTPIYEEKDYSPLVPYEKLTGKAGMEALKKIKEASENVEEWSKSLIKGLTEEKQKLTLRVISELANAFSKSSKSPLECLIDIYVRIGYETAMVKRVLQDEDVNWGTFIDHSPLELHCNSHSNNFAVLPPGHGNLVAPLDFDLTCSRSKFICIIPERKTYGKYDEELFDSYLNTERTELSRGLAGDENMNFAYSSEVKKEDLSLEDKLKDAVRYLLCDSMLETFMKIFDKFKCPHVIQDTDKNEAVHALIKIALIQTHNLIA